MKNFIISPLCLFLIIGYITSGCDLLTVDKERNDTFEGNPERISFANGRIDEASGLAASQTLGGYIWIHNDSGNPAELFLMSHDGLDLRSYPTPGMDNRDWEDIAVGPGPADGVSYIYVGDFGNNNANPGVTIQTIYRLPELKSRDAGFDAGTVARIRYRYPDGPHDAEALLVDPRTKDIFIISKEFEGATLYRLAFPQTENSVLTAEMVGKVPGIVLATGADISADGKEVVVRTYADVFYWKRGGQETIAQVLTRQPLKTLPSQLEPQGEAICFEKDMKGYYTLSERRDGAAVTLNYFRRK